MCCQSMRIVFLFSFTALSVFLHFKFVKIPTIIWYLLFCNVFSFVFYTLYRFFSHKISFNNLYYFSFIGGVFGSFLAIIFAKFQKQNVLFYILQSLILLIWIAVLLYLHFVYKIFSFI